MTAEIAVMNSEAVALAADSAVTMQTPAGPKIYQSANKIFRLSEHAPIALMVYDSASFLGVPWETIAKTYRAERGDEEFATLQAHADDFLKYVRNSALLFPASAKRMCAEQTAYSLFLSVLREIDRAIQAGLKSGPMDASQIEALASAVIETCSNYYKGASRIKGAPTSKSLQANLGSEIRQARDAVFGGFSLSSTDISRLNSIVLNSIVRDKAMPVRAPNRSGVVIAGFGTKEIYPSVFHVVLELLIQSTLKGVESQCTTVDAQMEAAILPFAQREIVDAFLGGIDPGHVNHLGQHWDGLIGGLGEKIADEAGLSGKQRASVVSAARKATEESSAEHADELTRRIQEDYAQPILDAVFMLPKGELGAMAESLVNLTSFRHKVSRQAETVGGPIDVAVISKGDGLIWIKRKHYFEPELNPQYFSTRFGRSNK